MYLDAQTNLAIEDYGLTSARLIYTPLISGLASVGGLVAATAALNTGLNQAFALTGRTFIVAALFGLTPGLLISRLQQQVEQNKKELVNSEPTQGAT